MKYCSAVLLTARSAGAIAVIRLAGPVADMPWTVVRSPRAAGLAVGAFVRSDLVSAGGEVIDDALVVRTGEHAMELHVHGGVAVVDAVLQALRDAEVRVIPIEKATGELLGAVGEIEGELQRALPRATTETALRLLLAQPRAWSEWASHWQKRLKADAVGRANASDVMWQFQSAAQWLLRRSAALARLLEPARVAIIGPPNAGKSTLANALLGRPVSITSDLAGTTRDWVDAAAIFSAGDVHVPVTLVDTAGIRATPDVLERESIVRTHRQAGEADVIILLLDATTARVQEEMTFLSMFRHGRVVVALNKIDAVGAPLSVSQTSTLAISAKMHQGLDALMCAVLVQLDLASVAFTEPFAFSETLKEMLHTLSLCDEPVSSSRILKYLI